MKGYVKLDSRAGVTLIELLVVILIIIILSVALLPVLKPFVVKAKYAAEGVPAVGHIRTLVAMHQTEKDVLPGVQSWEALITGTTDQYETLYACTSQSDAVLTAQNPGNSGGYVNAVQSVQGASAKIYYSTGDASDANVISTASILASHFGNQVELSGTDLMGKNAKPDQFQYIAMDSGFRDTSYAYAVGVFGKGGGIPAGTGYAVVEIVNAGNVRHPKITAVWQRYKEEKSTGPICLVVQSGASGTFTDANAVLLDGKDKVDRQLPIAQELIAGDGHGVVTTIPDDSAYLTAMRLAGWEFFF